jgi:translation initiation factor IF-3
MVAKYNRRNKRRRRREHYVNKDIRFPEVRLIDHEGENLGVISTKEALKKAQQDGFDLVVIAEKAKPPVAKMLDYNKFLYEEQKKQSAAKAKSSKSETKEFIFGPSIGEGDLDQRIERTRDFLEEGHRVKMTVRLRGRERKYPEIGIEKLQTAIDDLSDIARTEEEKPEEKGNMITITLVKK